MTKEFEIILIEDSESDAEIVLRALNRANIHSTVKHLCDGEEALNYFFENDTSSSLPKLILLDLKMPKIDGLEILKKIKSDDCTKAIPVIILSSSKEDKDIREAYKLGINSYVVKSADYEQFSKLVVDIAVYWLQINQAPIF